MNTNEHAFPKGFACLGSPTETGRPVKGARVGGSARTACRPWCSCVFMRGSTESSRLRRRHCRHSARLIDPHLTGGPPVPPGVIAPACAPDKPGVVCLSMTKPGNQPRARSAARLVSEFPCAPGVTQCSERWGAATDGRSMAAHVESALVLLGGLTCRVSKSISPWGCTGLDLATHSCFCVPYADSRQFLSGKFWFLERRRRDSDAAGPGRDC
jgi:hypothetical protein